MAPVMAERILIAEEDDGLRRTLASKLRRHGVVVYEASDTDTAGLILNSNQVHVVVIGMAGFGNAGLDLLRSSKEMQPLANVILLVGKHQGSFAIQGMKLGAFRDAQLPIHFESLWEIICEALKTKKTNVRRSKRRKILNALPNIFAAVTFAEHGEFETAQEFENLGRSEPDEE